MNTFTVKKADLASTVLIKQPYAITVAKHDFNVHEMRIMTRITEALQKDMLYGKTRSDVQKTLFRDKIIHLPTQSLLLKKSKNYLQVRQALKSLKQKIITVRGKDKYGSYETHTSLILRSKYYLNNQMVEIEIDKHILPDYLALASYSSYIAEVSMASSSRYIMRLYQFISHWKDRTEITVMISVLRELLELGDKYQKPKDLRKYVLEPAIKDLQERADVWFDVVSPIKAGRSITGYKLRVYKKSDNPRDADVHGMNIINILKELFKLREYHLGQLRSIISKPELHRHIYNKLEDIKYQIMKEKVKHVQAYVVATLKNEFGRDNSSNNMSSTYAITDTTSLPNQEAELDPQPSPNELLKRECFDKLFIDFGIDHLKVDNIVSKVPTEQLKTILDRVEEDLKKKKIPLADLKAQEYLLERLDERS